MRMDTGSGTGIDTTAAAGKRTSARTTTGRKICVITGGGSGMGLAAARVMGVDHTVLISGRSTGRLEGAIDMLRTEGIEAEAFPCDVSDRDSVALLARRARELGRIRVVIHAAGLSPHMGDARTVMAVNALGTIHVHEAFLPLLEAGACLIDVSSMSGHMLPAILLPTGAYPLSKENPEAFLRRMMVRVNLFPRNLRSSLAYGISKHFVIWYAKKEAGRFGEKGVRVLSVSPGSFETPMGEVEKDGLAAYVERSAFRRLGKVDEIAHLFRFLADERLGYLTGTDILCDGGCMAAGMH